MELLVFPVNATEEDVKIIQDDATKLVADFTATSNDSVFVMQNSDVRAFNKNGYTRADMDSTMADAVFSANIGDVVGPFRQGESFILYKVVGDDAKAEATVRHLLLTSE